MSLNNKTPKIIFHIDYQKDLDCVLRRLVDLDPAGLEYRLKEKKDLDRLVIKAILKEKKIEKKRGILDSFLTNYYRKNLTEMENVKERYQKIWEKRQKLFFSLVTEKMGGFTWKFNEYRFFVSSFYSRAAWGKSNNLAVWWKRKPEDQFHMNGYELILAHFFEIVDLIYKDKRPVSDWRLWALAEITAHLFIFKDFELTEAFWPKRAGSILQKRLIGENFKLGSYPQLANLAEEVYLLFKENSNYEKYVRLAIECVNDRPLKTLLG